MFLSAADYGVTFHASLGLKKGQPLFLKTILKIKELGRKTTRIARSSEIPTHSLVRYSVACQCEEGAGDKQNFLWLKKNEDSIYFVIICTVQVSTENII